MPAPSRYVIRNLNLKRNFKEHDTASETRTRIRDLTAPTLSLPPPFSLVMLREVGDAFAHAVSIAAEQGAGTLVYVGRFDLAEFAVVLEPDEPLRLRAARSTQAWRRLVMRSFLCAAGKARHHRLA